MAKPRVFVSSTYYDLKHIRNSLEAFIDGLGYESVLYEEGDIPFHHDSALDVSCYEEIKNCHILVLIIGGRYGSPASEQEDNKEEKLEFYNSITKKEYETARKNDIPIYVFIDKNVHSEYHTFRKNRDRKGIEYAHVDNVNIFSLIDSIYAQKRNNLIKDFEKFDEIACWLRDQWAGLFADFLSRKNQDKDLADLSTQVSGLKDLNSVLKGYTESIMEKLQPENFEQLISNSNKRLEDKLVTQFSKNQLIEYLLGHTPKGIGVKGLYQAFIQSKSLDDLLQKINFDEGFIQEVSSFEEAYIDFEHLKLELS
ncbi:DUF4062 domain-containing protein [Vibrio sp. 10N.222.49.C12]|uniref:DUF4062 domain-containing protein n=1 Tax=Vibrio sp. 10N.222.49.C12 TaxID=3229614 RepID=UPI00354FA79C